jgi:hypothetical protein
MDLSSSSESVSADVMNAVTETVREAVKGPPNPIHTA